MSYLKNTSMTSSQNFINKGIFKHRHTVHNLTSAKTCLTWNKSKGHECPNLCYIYIATKKYTL